MPYKIEKVKGGFYVVDPYGKRYSKHPLTKEQAINQIIAININEHRINRHPQTGLIFPQNERFYFEPLHSGMQIFPQNEIFHFEPLHSDMPIFL